jgi:hypothetical protein
MQIVYFSHSYRQEDQRVNDFFSRLMESEELIMSLDPPSDNVNSAKLQRHLNGCDGMVAVLTRRTPEVSPYIRFEINLCLRSRKPLLVYVEDVLPDGLVPPRVLQRRFSRGGFLRQVREHRHALRILKSYLGDEPPPRYQPGVAQRSCVIAGDESLPDAVAGRLDALLTERGYRGLRSSTLMQGDPAIAETLGQADVALSFVDATSRLSQYARGLLDGASVPTIEMYNSVTATDQFVDLDIPPEFQPRRVSVVRGSVDDVRNVTDAHLSLWEEDFLELPDQSKVDAYFGLLVDIGANQGSYSKADYERVVKVVMGDEYTVGQAGAVGPNSSAQNISFSQTWNQLAAADDTDRFAAELRQLRQHLRATAETPEHDVAIAALAEAQLEAEAGDGAAALERLSRLQRLKEGGKWAFGAATTIGTTVAAAALKAVLGL